MDAATFAVEAETEAGHWWFVGRRRLFGRMIARFGPSPTGRVLDIGTSTGTNLRLLRDEHFVNVVGLDNSDIAIRYCAEKGLGRVEKGDIGALPFADASFDFVLATDVIEHVDDDLAALREIHRVLKPGGRVLISVPAFPSLWGLQDRVAQHKRRYRARPLLARIASARLRRLEHFHFNFILFVPIWVARRVLDLFKVQLASEAEVNSPALNAFFTKLFACDVDLAPRLRPPFGVSLLVVAERPGEDVRD
ncbi:MAG: class I SAM-dependent methyltransferase [Pseudorhodoplanes sp.]